MTSRDAARALRAIPSERRSEQSRENGKKSSGRPKEGAPWAVWCSTDPYSPALVTRYYNQEASARGAMARLARDYTTVTLAIRRENGEYTRYE